MKGDGNLTQIFLKNIPKTKTVVCAIIGYLREIFGSIRLIIREIKSETERYYKLYKMDTNNETELRNNTGIVVFAFSSVFVSFLILTSFLSYFLIGSTILAIGFFMISIPLFFIGSAIAYIANQ